jgi:hypothetical protein
MKSHDLNFESALADLSKPDQQLVRSLLERDKKIEKPID